LIRVLLIEEDISVGAAIRLTLGRDGGDVLHVRDAQAGMKAFETADFDLVIVDLFIPGMAGVELISELRILASKTPILAMSGFRFLDSMDPGLDSPGAAAKMGVTAVLPKPFTPRQLMAAVGASLHPPAC